ncbi:hypothetical protein SGPA1_21877 [Streptomyces misionensis JCM 4497]
MPRQGRPPVRRIFFTFSGVRTAAHSRDTDVS